MGLLDDYQNIDENSGEEYSGIDPNATRRKRADLERQIAILDSDLKKTMREIEDIEIQKRRFKKEAERLRINRDELDKKAKSLDNDKRLLEEEIGGLKKKLKVL